MLIILADRMIIAEWALMTTSNMKESRRSWHSVNVMISDVTEWTHAICGDCWDEKNPERETALRYTKGDKEICCFCGKNTKSGIYVRHDGEKLECNHDN